MSVDIAAGKEAKQAVVFPKGTVIVQAHAGALVYLDGKSVGRATIDPLEVVEGQHELRLVDPDRGREEKRKIQVRTREEEVVRITWD